MIVYSSFISGTIKFNFAVTLTEGGSHCSAISAATLSSSTDQSPQISASFIDYSGRFPVTDLAIVLKKASGSVQYGGFDTNCSRFDTSRLGYWPSEYINVIGSHTVCTSMQSPLLNLSSGFTQVCIYLATNTGSGCKRSSREVKESSNNRSYYYAGQLAIAGFSTSTRLSNHTSPYHQCTLSLKGKAKKGRHTDVKLKYK